MNATRSTANQILNKGSKTLRKGKIDPQQQERDQLAQNLIAKIAQLVACLNEETQALDQDNYSVQGSLVERKNLLTRSYEELAQSIIQTEITLEKLSPETAKAFVHADKQLESALEKNMAAIKAAQVVSESIVHSLREAITESDPLYSKGYNRMGKKSGYGSIKRPLETSINKAL
jgi:hypothetical protein